MKNLMKVVLADADEGFRMMLQRVIEAAGDFKVAGSTGNGADAWRIIERECPQLVIMDVLLPELDGFVLLNRLAAMAERPRAILVSAVCQGQVVKRAMAQGAEAFVAKPCGANELLDQMRRVAQRAEEEDAYDAALERLVTPIIHELGMPAHIKGYQYVREAIVLTIKDVSMIHAVTKVLYPTVARRHNTTPSCVERAIRHAIEVAWNRGRLEAANRMYGMKLFDKQDRPSNGEFIATVADKVAMARIA